MAKKADDPDKKNADAKDQPEKRPNIYRRFRAWMHRHHGKLFWLHSVYALALGMLIAMFAAKSFDYARWLTLMLFGAWVMIFLIFRLHGEGRQQKLDTTGKTVRFLAMSYVVKVLYQTMLFFLLPFYWKTTTFDSPNVWFLIVLSVLAFLSTMDIIFDRFLMKWRPLASSFFALTLFACLNLCIPALFPKIAAVYQTMWAMGLAIFASWSMHVPLRSLKRPAVVIILLAAVGGGVTLAYFGRTVIPPVPLYVKDGSVGPELLKDGRLALKVTELHVDRLKDMHAVTDVVAPGGVGDNLIHVWRHDGRALRDEGVETVWKDGPEGTIRLRSKLPAESMPKVRVGSWSVDVETQDGQLVGRARFTVIE